MNTDPAMDPALTTTCASMSIPTGRLLGKCPDEIHMLSTASCISEAVKLKACNLSSATRTFSAHLFP
jgi:hypothetical protein